MRPLLCSILAYALLSCRTASSQQNTRVSSKHGLSQAPQQESLSASQPSSSVSKSLFAELERLARLVDISYCVGNTGVRKPFKCLSRCKEFPELSLETTWSTGFLMADSCGYIALDHGRNPTGSAGHDNDGDGGGSNGGDHGRSEGAIVVAFRGTYSIANTIVDLSTVPQKYVPYPAPDDGDNRRQRWRSQNRGQRCDNCTVHMGFLQSWQLARETVVPKLKDLKEKYPSYHIRLVGHSLGGAVACLAALELKLSLGWDDLSVTTFGEPRVGNYQLARYVDLAFSLDGTSHPEGRSYRRVTHKNDPVPLLPLEEWGYRSHAGELYIMKEELQPSEKDVRTCAGDADPACSSGVETSLLRGMRRLLRSPSPSTSAEGNISLGAWPVRLKLWQLFFAHRDYFWRLGLCVPGGDPANWERSSSDDVNSGEL